MHDIKYIRENPQEFDARMARRGLAPQSEAILHLDAENRAKVTHLQDLQAKRNEVAKNIGKVKGQGGDATDLLRKADEIKKEIADLEDADDQLEYLLCRIPNLLAADVPDGKSEDDNQEIRRWGEPKKFDFMPKAHDELAEKLGWADFEQTAKFAGARFVTLRGELARFERKLADMMLDEHINAGFEELRVPHLVWDKALYGTGNLPKFEEDLFKTTAEHYLIPTSEVPLTNMVRDSILSADELPKKFTAFTQCFRSEAGSAGKDTKGMIRLHEFSKVEMVAITKPEDSAAQHEKMLAQAENILQKLNLPYRVVSLCAGDTGFSAQKTYDLEVWLPSQNAYREISSISNCGSFQARRMKARYKTEDGKNEFVHTLNGSGLAVGRTIVAILENYQNEDGSVNLPKI
ncbi:MAG: serine--tRNA ligase [Alphaproteobacteria bacterium CG11_big_fil_rev_8_21_14_0_20_44_7]|nr:MAG: serine--tRNA ligase [Alphaproteobacteria bacterium CG11_big_fil_rev_8_21_14_0_20_44_7]